MPSTRRYERAAIARLQRGLPMQWSIERSQPEWMDRAYAAFQKPASPPRIFAYGPIAGGQWAYKCAFCRAAHRHEVPHGPELPDYGLCRLSLCTARYSPHRGNEILLLWSGEHTP
jgi:hypothetical protein